MTNFASPTTKQSQSPATSVSRRLVGALLLGLIMMIPAPCFRAQGRTARVLGFRTPESVIPGPDGNYYVSNINGFNVQDDGSIKVISGEPFEGTTEVSDLATGLFDPKGSVFVGNDLFVADVDRVWRINILDETPENKIVFIAPEDFPGGVELLNDIIVDAGGNFFVSDTFRGVIFKADSQGRVSVFYDSSATGLLPAPNGLIIDEEGQISGQAGSIIAVGLDTGDLIAVTADGSSVQLIAGGFGGGDGLAFDAGGNLFISNISGNRIFKMSPDRRVESFGRFGSPADISIDKEKGWLIVPSFNGTMVTFRELE